MTGPQKAWLDAHKQYRVIGGRPPGAGAKFVQTGMLHADGEFDQGRTGGRLHVRPGSFEVGMLEIVDVPAGPPRG
jgi:hypothetical protein